MRTVTICGVGLIGGSFALALRAAGFSGTILGVSSERSLEAALSRHVIDEGVPPEEGIVRADLIYLAQPISRIIEFLPFVAQHRRPDSLVTDVGSTKTVIMRSAVEFIPPAAVLGGHPMAGKEVRGVESASASLFDGRTYILTPASSETLRHPVTVSFVEWIERIGARLLVMDAAAHDRTISLTSHLVQIASTALACTISDGIPSTKDLVTAGPALRDSMRIALSSYELWRDILDTNRSNVEAAVDQLIAHLQQIKRSLGSAETDSFFEKGASLARSVRGSQSS